MTAHVPSQTQQCRICGFFTFSLETMNMHQQAVHGKEYVGYCVDCGKGFKSNLGYSIHKKMHEGEKDALKREESTNPALLCLACGC
jgi:hypothetical protein